MVLSPPTATSGHAELKSVLNVYVCMYVSTYMCMGARCARGARSCARSRTDMLNVAYVPIIAERDDGTSELKNVLLLQQLKQKADKSAVNCSTNDAQNTEWPAAEAAIAAKTDLRMRGVCPGTIHNATPDTAYMRRARALYITLCRPLFMPRINENKQNFTSLSHY